MLHLVFNLANRLVAPRSKTVPVGYRRFLSKGDTSMFRQSRNIFFACVSVLLVSAARPTSAQSLTGLFEFATDNSGNHTGPGWNARGKDTADNLWVIQGSDLNGAFLNGPSDAQADINLPLALGDNTFTVYSNVRQPYNTFGLNLFFNGSVTTPGISVFAPEQTSETTVPPFTANSAPSTYAMDISIVPGSGTLSFTDTNVSRRVTLIDYRFAQDPLFNKDRVGNLTTGADGIGDNIGQFTLRVTSVPAPSALITVLMGALPGATLLLRRRRQPERPYLRLRRSGLNV